MKSCKCFGMLQSWMFSDLIHVGKVLIVVSETVSGTNVESAGLKSRGSIFHFEFEALTKKMMSMTPTSTPNAIRTVAASGFPVHGSLHHVEAPR